jgi:predicted Zn-dependent protease
VGAISYAPYQEFEADAEGQLLAAQAGYDPAGGSNAMATIIERLEPTTAVRTPGSPIGEAAGAAGRGLEDFFRSHPRTDERIRRLREVERSFIAAHKGREYCRGVKNLADRTPCGFQRFDDEMVTY